MAARLLLGAVLMPIVGEIISLNYAKDQNI